MFFVRAFNVVLKNASFEILGFEINYFNTTHNRNFHSMIILKGTISVLCLEYSVIHYIFDTRLKYGKLHVQQG